MTLPSLRLKDPCDALTNDLATRHVLNEVIVLVSDASPICIIVKWKTPCSDFTITVFFLITFISENFRQNTLKKGVKRCGNDNRRGTIFSSLDSQVDIGFNELRPRFYEEKLSWERGRDERKVDPFARAKSWQQRSRMPWLWRLDQCLDLVDPTGRAKVLIWKIVGSVKMVTMQLSGSSFYPSQLFNKRDLNQTHEIWLDQDEKKHLVEPLFLNKQLFPRIKLRENMKRTWLRTGDGLLFTRKRYPYPFSNRNEYAWLRGGQTEQPRQKKRTNKQIKTFSKWYDHRG